MAGWAGYQKDLLRAAGLSTDAKHVNFIVDWNFHSSSNCTNNPVDISHPASGATHCQALTSTRIARKYPTPKSGASAFSNELHSGNFPNLLAALKGADPYAPPHPARVVRELNKWGSVAFANYYAVQVGGGPGKPIQLPRGHKGYHEFQKALARRLPTSLRRSKIIRGRVLRKMGAPRSLG